MSLVHVVKSVLNIGDNEHLNAWRPNDLEKLFLLYSDNVSVEYGYMLVPFAMQGVR